MKKIFLFSLILFTANVFASDPPHPATNGWSDKTTTGAAMGYCLAKHPYLSRYQGTGEFTPDGYEMVSSLGIIGAVRRNFKYERSTYSTDEGIGNSCNKACYEFGKLYAPQGPAKGVPLRQIVSESGAIRTSGIGDMAILAVQDWDFYLSQKVDAGVWSRGNHEHESNVAQADFCCCQVK